MSHSKIILCYLTLILVIINPLNVITAKANAYEYSFTEISFLSGKIVDVKVSDNILFVVDADRGILTYNISNPSNLLEMDQFLDSYAFAHSMIIDGNYAYLADYEDGLEIIDISDPFDLRKIGQYSSNAGVESGSTEVSKSGDLVFLASQNSGLEIINCSDPSNPAKISEYITNHRAIRVHAVGNLLFLSEAHNGFKILEFEGNIYDVIYHFEYTESIQDFAIAKDILYVSDTNYGLRVFDLRDLSNITQIGEKEIEDSSYGLVVEQRDDKMVLFLLAWEAGVFVYDVTTSEDLKLLGRYDDEGKSFNLVVNNDLIFIAEFTDGMEILQIDKQISARSSLSFNLFPFLLVFVSLRFFSLFTKKSRKFSTKDRNV
ncbi:MAG: LVIVD repeat-containing protein [Candidatus Hodarchaeales archaeon]